MHIAYVSIGSNIAPESHIPASITLLKKIFVQVKCSPIYRSDPIGFKGNPFLNLVAEFKTAMSVDEVKEELKNMEKELGRSACQQGMANRVIDIDLLMYDELEGDFGRFLLPHPETTSFDYILKPLTDLAPDLIIPGTHSSTMQHWMGFSQTRSGIRQIDLDSSKKNQ